MNFRIILFFFILYGPQSIVAQVWYISGNGNDTNDGKTAATAFRTLQKAADLVQPGDLVWIGDGTYSNADQSNGSAVLSITRSGRSDAWITWKARPGHRPEIRPTGWAGIQVSGSYHLIEGLNVIGNNDAIVLLHALEDAKKEKPNPFFNTNGIFINGRTRKPEEKPHHVIVRNCTVGKCAGGGIIAIETDYVTIEDCQVYENAWFMRYGGSGISTLHNWAFDDAPGYHIIIQRNKVWNNKTLVPWEKIGKLSDGNGIILDVTDQDQVQGATNPNANVAIKTNQTKAPEKPQRPEWKGRALVANNLSAFNGGSGIHTFRTKYVDIVNNTTYWNGQIVGYQELFPNRSEDVVILNNIIVPRPGGKVTSNNKNVNIRWDYNLYPAAQDVFVGQHDLLADPGFINVQADLLNADFSLAKKSKAIGSGSTEMAPSMDLQKKARPLNKGVNRGCY